MYKKFFGLTRNPFEISPDPYFLFATPRYKEAFASVVHGIQRHKGFIVVTGEVGTGKTLLVRCVLQLLHRDQIEFANVFNPCLTPLEFLRYVVGDLGLRPGTQDKASLLQELNNYLVARFRKNTTTVLIVDEAQDLEPGLLEEIRLLTNLETSQQKLLQIVLVGQPELDQKMDSPELRQLKQRIALRCQLEPLTEEEARTYLLRRLDRAGANSHATDIFPEESMAAIYRYSRGIPRLVNTICENALIAAYAEKAQVARVELIDGVAKDLRLNVFTHRSVSQPHITVGQRALAKSLLELVEALETVARGNQVREVVDEGVKII